MSSQMKLKWKRTECALMVSVIYSEWRSSGWLGGTILLIRWLQRHKWEDFDLVIKQRDQLRISYLIPAILQDSSGDKASVGGKNRKQRKYFVCGLVLYNICELAGLQNMFWILNKGVGWVHKNCPSTYFENMHFIDNPKKWYTTKKVTDTGSNTLCCCTSNLFQPAFLID